jgi:hypothetical protein
VLIPKSTNQNHLDLSHSCPELVLIAQDFTAT